MHKAAWLLALLLIPLWLIPLWLIGCGNDPTERPAGATPTMSPTRHCEVAREQARLGDCLSAGEHLAFCTGPDSTAARAEARATCGGKTTASSEPPVASGEVPPVISATSEPSAEPPAQPSAPSSAATTQATSACNEAIAHALSRRCTAARSALSRCSGPKRNTAQAHVNASCRRTKGDELFE